MVILYGLTDRCAFLCNFVTACLKSCCVISASDFKSGATSAAVAPLRRICFVESHDGPPVLDKQMLNKMCAAFRVALRMQLSMPFCAESGPASTRGAPCRMMRGNSTWPAQRATLVVRSTGTSSSTASLCKSQNTPVTLLQSRRSTPRSCCAATSGRATASGTNLL